jgi:hypothetical protein
MVVGFGLEWSLRRGRGESGIGWEKREACESASRRERL